MAANKKTTKETGELVDNRAIALDTYKGSFYAKEIEFTAGASPIRDAAKSRCSEATIWIECDDFESLIIDRVRGNRFMMTNQTIDLKKQELAETAIREARKTFDYNTVEYPLEYFIGKLDRQNADNNLHWDEAQQSYFIESLLLGLPFGYIVINNNSDALEIIDGQQRLYTAINFVKSNLRLESLQKLGKLNGFAFEDLLLPRQRTFLRISIRTIEVDGKLDLSVWHQR